DNRACVVQINISRTRLCVLMSRKLLMRLVMNPRYLDPLILKLQLVGLRQDLQRVLSRGARRKQTKTCNQKTELCHEELVLPVDHFHLGPPEKFRLKLVPDSATNSTRAPEASRVLPAKHSTRVWCPLP